MKSSCYPGFSGSVFSVLRICAYWLLLSFCLSHHTQASSLPPVLLDAQSGDFKAVELEVFKDISAKLTLRDVMSPAINQQFQPFQGMPDFGYTRSAVWARVRVLNQSDDSHRWLLLLGSGTRDGYFTVYNVPDSHLVGDELPQPLERLPFYQSDTYATDFNRGETYTVYVRVHNLSSRLAFRLNLSPEGGLFSAVQLQQLIMVFLAGACLALALYNLLLFFTFYESSYLTLFGLIICWLLDGGSDVFVPRIGKANFITYRYVFLMMLLVFSLQMVRQVIRPQTAVLKGVDKTIDNVLLTLIVFALLLNVVLPLLEFKVRYVIVFLGIMIAPVLLSVIRAVYLKRPMARWFLLAVFFLVTLVGIKNILVNMGVFSVENGVVGVMIDGTGMLLFLMTLSLMQISRTRRLREDRERAEAANQAKSHFLTTMTHELRTPMNAIVGIGGLMKSTPLDVEQKDYLEKLSAASQHLLTLINDILDFSEVEQTEIKLDIEVFNLHQVVTDIDKILSEQARKKGLTLSCHCRLPADTYIKGDSTRLMQIIMNLCGNAIKFTEQGRVELLIEPLPTDGDNKTVLQFTVTDTGIGMSAGALKELFQPFSQVDKGTKRSYGGSGLGLFISKQLVSVMGGELAVTSKPEEGSRFFFTLGFETASAAEKQGIIAPAAGVERIAENMIKSLSGKHVLLVDDDEINCFVAERFLGKRDMIVSTAGDGQEALQALQERGSESFDLIFMDISMPGMDGYATTRKIRSMGFADIPIIALTAHGIIGERERCIAAGMNDFCTKPFALSEFERLLVKWVNV